MKILPLTRVPTRSLYTRVAVSVAVGVLAGMHFLSPAFGGDKSQPNSELTLVKANRLHRCMQVLRPHAETRSFGAMIHYWSKERNSRESYRAWGLWTTIDHAALTCTRHGKSVAAQFCISVLTPDDDEPLPDVPLFQILISPLTHTPGGAEIPNFDDPIVRLDLTEADLQVLEANKQLARCVLEQFIKRRGATPVELDFDEQPAQQMLNRAKVYLTLEPLQKECEAGAAR